MKILVLMVMLAFTGLDFKAFNEVKVNDNSVDISEGDYGMKSVIELDSSQRYSNEFRIIYTDFLVPVDFSEDDVVAHVEWYISKMKQEYADTYSIVAKYYDDEIYYYSFGTSVATVRWARRGAISFIEGFGFALGDYSEHTLRIKFHELDVEYELTEEEKRIYVELQEYAREVLGEPLYHYTYPSSDKLDSIYIEIAQRNAISFEEIVAIRDKATLRRTMEETAMSVD